MGYVVLGRYEFRTETARALEITAAAAIGCAALGSIITLFTGVVTTGQKNIIATRIMEVSGGIAAIAALFAAVLVGMGVLIRRAQTVEEPDV